MSKNIFEELLLKSLEYYLMAPLEYVLQGIKIKERFASIDGLQLIIYSNDHNPPHFHVKTKDGKIDARFTFEDCSLMKGSVIGASDEKRIKAFFIDQKSRILMDKIWSKRHA